MCEGNIDWLPLARPQTGDLASNPGMYPDRKLNQRPFSLQAGAQSTEPHQPGWGFFCLLFFNFYF